MKLNLGVPQQLKLKRIRRSAQNSGWMVDPKVVEAIRVSMHEFGQYAPIIVSKLGDDDYVLVDGRHRFEAAESSEQEDIWAYVLDGDGDEAELLGLSSNLHRRRLSDPEFETAMKRLEALQDRHLDGGGPAPLVTKREIAKMLGTNTTDVKRTRALEKLTADCRAAFEAGEINKGVAYELTKLDAEEQARLLPQARLVKQKKLTRDDFRDLVKEACARTAPVATGARSKPQSNAGVTKIHELPGARWHRLIDTGVSDDELNLLAPEEARSLHRTACELLMKAGRVKERLERMGVTESEAIQTASGVKP